MIHKHRAGLLGFAVLAMLAGVALSDSFAGSLSRRTNAAAAELTWSHLSTATNDLPTPSASAEQVLALILDIDKDGVNDFVIGARGSPGPSLVWYQRRATTWSRYVIETDALQLEAGGAFFDIDNDGDPDIVAGNSNQGNRIWWWENPFPDFSPNTVWTRRLIKDGGANKHHDMIFGDFDGDADPEFVYWNQGDKKLMMVNIPANPRATQPWPGASAIFTAPDSKYEGLTQADVDGDGKIDLIGGGYWFKHTSGTNFTANNIKNSTFTRVAAGQLIPGGRPEIVQIPGDVDGPGRWFTWDGSSWIGRDLPIGTVKHGHSLDIADVNGDGRLDIFVGEMRFATNNTNANPNARTLVLLGDGQGNFTVKQVATGFGHHESRLGDLDGDGDIDILGKAFTWDTPRLDIWLNSSDGLGGTDGGCSNGLDEWRTHIIDTSRPHRAVFIDSADLNGDGRADIIAGAWWYENPGAPSGVWRRREVGPPFNEMAVMADFDGDGDIDMLGTKWDGASTAQKHKGNAFVWARNDGAGNFVIHDNIQPGNGDFLQGAVIDSFAAGAREVILSWHNGTPLQALTIPANPVGSLWTIRTFSSNTQSEDLSVGDIDRDGDDDLLTGTRWLENRGASWSQQTLFNTTALPDRNRLADINGDGRLDAVIGYEAISALGKLSWYRAPANAIGPWTEQIIDTIIGPMSLDVGDADGDGDLDVVVGEHNLKNPQNGRVFIYENNSGVFARTLVATGHEHHDGTQFVDVDNDGDLDIISIGWAHDKILLYEQVSCSAPQPTRTPTPPPGPTVTPTPTATPVNPGPTGALFVSSQSGGTVAGVEFADEDILRFDNGTEQWTLYFDGSDVGLARADVDAFHLLTDGRLLLSLDTAFSVSGVGTVDDSDIIAFTPSSLGNRTAGSFALYFDGSDVELTTNAEDVDAIAVDSQGNLLLSTVGNGAIGSLRTNDEDILRFIGTTFGNTTAGSWSLIFDGSTAGLDTSDEDINGLSIGNNNAFYLSTLAGFQLGGITGRAHDIFVCVAAAGGATCATPATLFWQGGQYGFTGEVIDALHVSGE